MSYDIPKNLKDLEEKIKNLEIRINEFNQLNQLNQEERGTKDEFPFVYSAIEPAVESGTEVPVPVVESETKAIIESGPDKQIPVVESEKEIPVIGIVQAKVAAIEQKIEKNSPLLSREEFDILGPGEFGTDLKVINKFLNILTIIEKNSNDVDTTLKSALNDKLKEKYITKGQQLFDETTLHIKEYISIFCEKKEAIKAYFNLYNIIEKFYKNLTNKPSSSYNSLYKLMIETKKLSNDEFYKYIYKLIAENNTKYLEIKSMLFSNNCITGNESFNLETSGGRKTRKIKHRKTKRRGKGHKKSHKKRHSKSHKKRHSKSHKKRH